MNNTTNNSTTNKFLGLPLTGIALLGIAATNIGMLVINKVIPLINGTLIQEMLPGVEVEAGVQTGVMGVFIFSFAVFALSYLLMALLGVNALRLGKNPEGVKARTGLAKFLVFTGVVSLLSSVSTIINGATAGEILALIAPALTQLALTLAFLTEVKTIKSEMAALCA